MGQSLGYFLCQINSVSEGVCKTEIYSRRLSRRPLIIFMFPLFQNRGISESVKQESLDIVDSATCQIVNIYINCHCIYVY